MLMLATIIFAQCVEEYDPGISEDTNLVAIDGSLVKGREKQRIVISRTSPLADPSFNPITGCEVKIVDDQGNEFHFTETSDGVYTAEIENDALQFSRGYQLVFNTPDGNSYASSWEAIVESAPVDSVYYEIESQYSEKTDQTTQGVQFYVDLKAPEEGARYYRWELEETYEFTSQYTIGGYFEDGDTTIYTSSRDSLYRCWNTESVEELFSENTVNLIRNEKKQIPLHYVEAGTRKLGIRYSTLVKQYALNENAYNYWNQRKVDAKESGGLYTQQPSQAKSNINNVNNGDERVLGYFWTSSLSEKRIFYDEHFYYHKFTCEVDTFTYAEYADAGLPVYFVGGTTLLLLTTAHPSCFDCSYNNGAALEPPEFW